MAPKGKVTFKEDICKGCGLCVSACKVHVLAIDEERLNRKGYHPVHVVNADACIGCQNCAVMCPDVVITVEKEKIQR